MKIKNVNTDQDECQDAETTQCKLVKLLLIPFSKQHNQEGNLLDKETKMLNE